MNDSQPQSLYVLAWPAFKSAHDNIHAQLVYDQMPALGADVQEFTIKKLLDKRRVPAIWHMHFPEKLLRYRNPIKVAQRLLRLIIRMRAARRRGTKVVWTVHNMAHDGARHRLLEPLFWRYFLAHVDACIHLSEMGREVACKRYPRIAGIPGYVVPHAHYRGGYPDTVTRDEARRQLDIPAQARVGVCIGQMRPYKNLPHLIRTFRNCSDPNYRLLIAGWPRERDLAQTIREETARDQRVITHFRFVPDDELQVYMRAADLTLIPYTEILNSGALMLALSFDCPVLAADKGALRQFSEQVGSEWVTLYTGDLQSDTLARALDSAATASRAAPDLEQFEPLNVAKLLMAAFRDIAGRNSTFGQ